MPNHTQEAATTTTTLRELEGLMQELSPGTALTHQRQIVAPIVYRKAAVLAAADDLHRYMDLLSQIVNLLLIGQQQLLLQQNFSASLTEKQVVEAPIVIAPTVQDGGLDDDRLDELAGTLVSLQSRVQTATSRLDCMLENYNALVAAVSEKLVLFEEEIQSKEGKDSN
jgi:hypothetical protein